MQAHNSPSGVLGAMVDEEDPKVEDESGLASSQFWPLVRSGWWTDIGSRRLMEDAHVCIDDLDEHFGSFSGGEGSCAFYGVSSELSVILVLSVLRHLYLAVLGD